MQVNEISFRLTEETFGPDIKPTDVVEIDIDGRDLGKIISSGCPLWPEALYTSLMRVYALKGETVNIFVCGCGCVGCGDTEVRIEETDHFVIWYDFYKDGRLIETNRIFVFDKTRYYAEVDQILQWMEEKRLACYIGNVMTVWSDERRCEFLADSLSEFCALSCDFKEVRYEGKDAVMRALRRRFSEGDYQRKVTENYLYRIDAYRREAEEMGYQKWCLALCRHQKSQDVAMYVLFRTDTEGKICEILLSRNKEWFHPVCWDAECPGVF